MTPARSAIITAAGIVIAALYSWGVYASGYRNGYADRMATVPPVIKKEVANFNVALVCVQGDHAWYAPSDGVCYRQSATSK